MDAWKHIRAVLVLPFMVTVVIPGALLASFGFDTLDLWHRFRATRLVLSLSGVLFVIAGLWLLVQTVRMFAQIGQGTLAPWDPTKKLVVHGVYRHVRNPMISGVASILMGETLLSTALPMLIWTAFFILVNVIYIPLAEEPGLVNRFGTAYEEYRRNVPRWIPRRRAWEQPADAP